MSAARRIHLRVAGFDIPEGEDITRVGLPVCGTDGTGLSGRRHGPLVTGDPEIVTCLKCRAKMPGLFEQRRRRQIAYYCPSCEKTWGVIDGRCESCGGPVLEEAPR